MPVLSFLETCMLGTSHQTSFKNLYVLSPLVSARQIPRMNRSACVCVGTDCMQTSWISSSSSVFGEIKVSWKCLCPQTLPKAYSKALQ